MVAHNVTSLISSLGIEPGSIPIMSPALFTPVSSPTPHLIGILTISELSNHSPSPDVSRQSRMRQASSQSNLHNLPKPFQKIQ
jgi:hypothetical protein